MSRIVRRGLTVAAGLFILTAGSLAPGQEASTQPVPSTQQAEQPRPEAATQPATQPATTQAAVRLNFKEASLRALLEYLSETVGLVILEEARVDGRVTVMSRQPLSTAEALSLLDTVLKQNGYAAIRNGRTLKIVTLDNAKRSSIPVRSGNDPAKVQASDRVITQVIPISFADAVRLKADLASLKPAYADLASNAASNALIVTATEADVRRFMEIIKALDQHLAGVADVKVFQLTYANATNAAKLITELFKPETDRAGQAQVPAFMRRAFGGRGRGGEEGDQEGQQAGGRQARVIATADDRTNTLVVSAPPDVLTVIEGIVKDLDSNPSAEQDVFIYSLKNPCSTRSSPKRLEPRAAAGARGPPRPRLAGSPPSASRPSARRSRRPATSSARCTSSLMRTPTRCW
jgi:type II secretory pathway component GspD/PulD (secretin)